MTSGQVVLVTAAAGGTGQFAVQVSWWHLWTMIMPVLCNAPLRVYFCSLIKVVQLCVLHYIFEFAHDNCTMKAGTHLS